MKYTKQYMLFLLLLSFEHGKITAALTGTSVHLSGSSAATAAFAAAQDALSSVANSSASRVASGAISDMSKSGVDVSANASAEALDSALRAAGEYSMQTAQLPENAFTSSSSSDSGTVVNSVQEATGALSIVESKVLPEIMSNPVVLQALTAGMSVQELMFFQKVSMPVGNEEPVGWGGRSLQWPEGIEPDTTVAGRSLDQSQLTPRVVAKPRRQLSLPNESAPTTLTIPGAKPNPSAALTVPGAKPNPSATLTMPGTKASSSAQLSVPTQHKIAPGTTGVLVGEGQASSPETRGKLIGLPYEGVANTVDTALTVTKAQVTEVIVGVAQQRAMVLARSLGFKNVPLKVYPVIYGQVDGIGSIDFPVELPNIEYLSQEQEFFEGLSTLSSVPVTAQAKIYSKLVDLVSAEVLGGATKAADKVQAVKQFATQVKKYGSELRQAVAQTIVDLGAADAAAQSSTVGVMEKVKANFNNEALKSASTLWSNVKAAVTRKSAATTFDQAFSGAQGQLAAMYIEGQMHAILYVATVHSTIASLNRFIQEGAGRATAKAKIVGHKIRNQNLEFVRSWFKSGSYGTWALWGTPMALVAGGIAHGLANQPEPDLDDAIAQILLAYQTDRAAAGRFLDEDSLRVAAYATFNNATEMLLANDLSELSVNLTNEEVTQLTIAKKAASKILDDIPAILQSLQQQPSLKDVVNAIDAIPASQLVRIDFKEAVTSPLGIVTAAQQVAGPNAQGLLRVVKQAAAENPVVAQAFLGGVAVKASEAGRMDKVGGMLASTKDFLSGAANAIAGWFKSGATPASSDTALLSAVEDSTTDALDKAHGAIFAALDKADKKESTLPQAAKEGVAALVSVAAVPAALERVMTEGVSVTAAKAGASDTQTAAAEAQVSAASAQAAETMAENIHILFTNLEKVLMEAAQEDHPEDLAAVKVELASGRIILERQALQAILSVQRDAIAALLKQKVSVATILHKILPTSLPLSRVGTAFAAGYIANMAMAAA